MELRCPIFKLDTNNRLGPRLKIFLCSTELSMNFSYLLAEKFSCSAMFSKKEFAIICKIYLQNKFHAQLSWA